VTWAGASSLSLVLVIGTVTGSAQTLWEHINHPRTGNVIVALVDLNTASTADLMRLPGVAESDAQKIVRGRPYKTTSELLDKKIVPAEVYAKISGRVIAREDSR
jgi:DNA uptake protein ComE-like DNA-binding protein